ncbi:myb-like protein X [Senna tora]|uniref:Myb-like protein X n=1 Tax=Senna tora TaxID=362788 RepID=A0A834XCU9_9FABA|nr:myb-like protein X [Senna tora]
MFRARGRRVRFSEPFKLLRSSSFCSKSKNGSGSTNSTTDKHVIADERYRQLENMDFMTAAKMLFTDPPKKKKFGLDFHLVQLFFACLPSLAVYLVAQYARYDMKIMEAEVEQKKKLRDEQEAKEKEEEMKLNPPEKEEEKSNPQLLEVKVRLEKLEEAVKEIEVETKKQSSSNLPKNQVSDDEKKQSKSSTVNNITVEKDNLSTHDSLNPKPELGQENLKGSMVTPDVSPEDQKSQNPGGGASPGSE